MHLLRRLSVLAAAVTAAGLLAPTAAAHAAAATVSVTAPANGATVSGPVTLTAVGNAASGDHAESLSFKIDGQDADFEICSSTVASCTKSYVWDATGLSGQHTVQVTFESQNGPDVTSAVTTVTVVSPAPTVTVTSPAPGGLVPSGTAAVTAVGSVDPSQNDAGSFATLLVDGQDTDVEQCPTPVSRTCAVTFSWRTDLVTGPHSLQAQFETSKGVVVASAAVEVTVHVVTKSTLEPVDPIPYGHTAHVAGEVVSASGLPLAGVPVTVVVQPSSGKPTTKVLTTNAEGEWKLSVKAKVNTGVVASVAESASWGASHASTRVLVFATGKCVTKDEVRPGATDALSCTKLVPALAKGSKVQVQELVHKKWHTISTAKVSGSAFKVPFRLTARGSAEVRLYLPASRTLTDSATSSFFISVD